MLAGKLKGKAGRIERLQKHLKRTLCGILNRKFSFYNRAVLFIILAIIVGCDKILLTKLIAEMWGSCDVAKVVFLVRLSSWTLI